MKLLIIGFIIFLPHVANCQVNSILVDEKSKDPIPYASIYIKNQMKGTSSNGDGSFELLIDANDSLIISSIGYETQILAGRYVSDTIFLETKILELKEVQAKPKKRNKLFPAQNRLGNVNRTFFKNTSWIGSAGYPYEIARYFKFDDEISSTRFVQSVTFLTDSDIDDAIFLVKFYKKGVNGLPDELLNTNKIIAKAKKGIHKTKVNLEDEFIYFPKEGIFVAVEFLVIKQNKFKKENPFTYEGKLYEYNYEPKFSTVQVDAHPFHY